MANNAQGKKKKMPLAVKVFIVLIVAVVVVVAALVITIYLTPDFSNDYQGFQDLVDYILRNVKK